MTQPLIRTRAEEDAADFVLRASNAPLPPTSSITPTISQPTPPTATSAMDTMWSEYETYLSAARAAQEAGIDIFPQPAFVVKVSLLRDGGKGKVGGVKRDLLDDEEKSGDSESDKLFINVCTDACVDAPEIVKQSTDASPPSALTLPASDSSSSSTPLAAPPGSLRLPMSVGPLTPCTSRSGAPCVAVDVVIHPGTLVQPLDDTHSQAAYQYAVAQAALIQRQSGTAPPVLTPAQQQSVAMRELKRTIATFALQRIEEKYKLRVDEAAEVKFPKVVYKGSLPAGVQRIRRNKANPLHALTPQQREEREKRGKVLVQEVAQSKVGKPIAVAKASVAPPAKALAASAVSNATVVAAKAAEEHDSKSAEDAKEQVGVSKEVKQLSAEEPSTVTERFAAPSEVTTVTPVYSLDTSNGQLTLQVQLPGVSSSAEVDATVTSADIRITAVAKDDKRTAYDLHVVFPSTADDERVQAKFNKKRSTITLTMPLVSQPAQPAAADVGDDIPAVSAAEPATTLDTLPSTDAAATSEVDQLSSGVLDKETAVDNCAESGAVSGCGVVAGIDWAARLGLSNRLIDQSCLTYN